MIVTVGDGFNLFDFYVHIWKNNFQHYSGFSCILVLLFLNILGLVGLFILVWIFHCLFIPLSQEEYWPTHAWSLRMDTALYSCIVGIQLSSGQWQAGCTETVSCLTNTPPSSFFLSLCFLFLATDCGSWNHPGWLSRSPGPGSWGYSESGVASQADLSDRSRLCLI